MTTQTIKTFQPKDFQEAARIFVLPLIAFVVFLGLWSYSAARIETSLGQVPGPVAVWGQAANLVEEHRAERQKEAAFFERQEKRNKEKLAEDPDASVRIRPYTGKPTFFDQIITSLLTVFTGFLLATVIAVPLGVLTGLSNNVYRSINPIVQIFKPVSPLAWLPIVTIIVSAVYVTDEPMFSKSFVTSAITVTLCCLWPTLINTAVGVSSVDRDLMNVGKVLRLGWFSTVWKIALPSAIPMIFTGMRLSLSIGWMVLIAAEMLAQNPGLGKFVWDEFQNGSSNSLGRIMVAVFTIGIIGFLLDRGMLMLQRRISWDKDAVLR
ncbi:MAG: ABC transporter permease [Gammaproteobacteria bacterium]|jgi:nitrate/nitrite transport system permease protein|nr:ABC transporter permease [Gammaproteobacteria bacterium]MDH3934305.1 ABC transporter permease [Gammaproteobacteria bacterium]MDH3971019.1 ABC transporter permease [Gammaproteobacteria bacterium]MDH3985340.1 ABC transporter permease [Gammaproteobacteria bacterium]